MAGQSPIVDLRALYLLSCFPCLSLPDIYTIQPQIAFGFDPERQFPLFLAERAGCLISVTRDFVPEGTAIDFSG